tara:strand:+ start:420 stop:836 length:417 start_codon:yes stop_codon:yes gene_type:complete
MMECSICRSTGHVTIYHPSIVFAVITNHEGQTLTLFDGLRNVNHRIRTNEGNIVPATCDIPCSCLRGEQFATWRNRDGSTRTLRRFGESRLHVRALDFSPDALDACGWSTKIENHIREIATCDPIDNEFNAALARSSA